MSRPYSEPMDLSVQRSISSHKQHRKTVISDRMHADWMDHLFAYPSISRPQAPSRPSNIPSITQNLCKMTLDTDSKFCSVCSQTSQVFTPASPTFPRILKALDINKISQQIPKSDQEKISTLCVQCEAQIKRLEDAQQIKEKLTDTFMDTLRRMGVLMSISNELSPPYITSHRPTPAFQQYNEITPYHQSTKRKVLQSESTSRRKQLKTQITHALPISPSSNTSPTYSDDGENSSQKLVIDEGHDAAILSPSSSKHSSPPRVPKPPTELKSNPNNVLTETTSSRNRRKQARPHKAASEEHIENMSPTESRAPVLPPITQSGLTTTPTQFQSISSISTSATTPTGSHIHSAFPKIDTNMLTTSQGMFNSMPSAASYQALFGANLAALTTNGVKKNNNVSTTPSQKQVTKLSVGSLFPMSGTSINSTPSSIATSSTHTVTPLTPAASPASSLSSSFNNGSTSFNTPTARLDLSATRLDIPADKHTLLKTDKRRYCKVCAAANRKANNGRPPQSRFLCSVCCVPMCRSCIEEHRYRILMKTDEADAALKSSDKSSSAGSGKSGSSNSSASARLLQAVKMKEKNSPRSQANSHSIYPPPATSTPSSLLYSNPTAAATFSRLQSAHKLLQFNPFMSHLPFPTQPFGLSMPHLAMPLDMSVPMTNANLPNIAPAPPKLVNMSSKIKQEVQSPGEARSPASQRSAKSPITDSSRVSHYEMSRQGMPVIRDVKSTVKLEENTGSQAVTSEVVNKTVEMLANMDTVSIEERKINPMVKERPHSSMLDQMVEQAFNKSPNELPFSATQKDEEFLTNNPPTHPALPIPLPIN